MINTKFKLAGAILLAATMAACAKPGMQFREAQLPDGSPVKTANGEGVVCGMRTTGGSMTDANYDAVTQPTPVSQAAQAQIVSTVAAPTVLQQTTGAVTGLAVGAGNVMGGIAAINYSDAVAAGKLKPEGDTISVSAGAASGSSSGATQVTGVSNNLNNMQTQGQTQSQGQNQGQTAMGGAGGIGMGGVGMGGAGGEGGSAVAAPVQVDSHPAGIGASNINIYPHP